ncbi:MAG: nucleotidyl transferase AbiEii/AbiGii toxin family protein [Prolixibacteraceae bacterium]|nr:nucleotidyl transferase AbiEii/AbiGii toxin family protein [Prolixibacteraceae bacterium]MBN2650363.1 nucleotidyl transferase AbiEii/AbiGii toxin family protein [Prolixibacteraceae bacterium]
MLDINRHKFIMLQILKDIYSDIEISSLLGFKGGTALMFFYNLPRFSVDLDFNLLDNSREEMVYKRIREIAQKHGTIHDEAQKFFGIIVVVNYGTDERKLKIEISNRNFNDDYEVKSYLGIAMKVMNEQNMFAHKLCAMLDRNTLTPRDIFDSWFFMQKQTPVNRSIIEKRMKMPFEAYIQKCIEHLEHNFPQNPMQGLGELMDHKMKIFVKNELKKETISLLRFYKEYPITIDR